MKPELLLPLQRALRRLEKLDWRERGFDMNNWAHGGPPKRTSLGCGTAGCAYMVGTALRSWQKAGVTLYLPDQCHPGRWWPVEDAAERLDLTDDQWNHIFMPDHYLGDDDVFGYDHCGEKLISPGRVAEHIQQVLDGQIA